MLNEFISLFTPNLSIFGVAMLLGFLSPLIGIFLVMRRFSLLADTLAHVSLLGVALSTWLNVPIALGAFMSAVIGGGSIELLRQSKQVLSEATLAIFLSGSLALAVMIFAVLGVDAEEIEAYLFGDLATVTHVDFSFLLGIALVLGIFFTAFYRRLFLVAIDEDLARINGVAVNRLNLIFMLLAATVVAATTKVVGVLLVSSLIVLPVMAAFQWHVSFKKTLWLSLLFSEGAVVLGFVLVHLDDFPSGASIALISLLIFLFSYLLNVSRK